MGFWAVVIASVFALFLWGLFSPRSQWRVLAAWSYRSPEADEPGPFAFGVHRVISAIGVVFFGILGFAALGNYLASLPPQPPTLTALQQMWGVAPAPQVVNRVIGPHAEVPAGLIELPIEGYQAVDNAQHSPRYLYTLREFNTGGDADYSGLVGTRPPKDFPALESAELVVNVRAWTACIPRAAVVIETEETVQIAIYVGQQNRQDDVPIDHLSCDRPPLIQHSLLVPVNLSAPVGDRTVASLDGSPIPVVNEVKK